MRLHLALLLGSALLAGGCDRASREAEQGNAATPDEVTAAPGAPAAPANGDTGVDEIGVLDRAQAGQAATSLAFTAPDGRSVTLADFRGKPVLLNLWATWCTPCIREMPTLDRLAVQAGDALTVLVVSQDMDGPAKVQPYFARAGFQKLQPYLDPELKLSIHYRANLPTTILFDSQGREVWRMLGGMDWTTPTARTLIAEAR